MRELDEAEIDAVLVQNGVGILAMVDETHPYAIPMSFGYDGEQITIAMQWGGGIDGRKTQIIESNPNVCLTVIEQDTERDVWRSVIVRGELSETQDEPDQAYASLTANATFPNDLGVWGTQFEDVEFGLYGLQIQDCTGRAYGTNV